MSKLSTVFECKLLTLSKNHEVKGNLTAVSNNSEVPFDVKRLYYLYDIPGGSIRGGHGHKELRQFVVALSGSFEITLDDGLNKKFFRLSRPNEGLFVPSGLWRELTNFSSGSVCLVLASEFYSENDYFRNYEEFVEWKKL